MDVSVRSPFPFEALPRVWGWIQKFRHKVADDFSPATQEEFVSSMAGRWEREKTWAIYGDGELGGLVTFERLSPWLGTAHMTLKPEFQGKGAALYAARAAIADMFASCGVEKLAFFPLAGNLALFSLLVNVGARREGILRGHTAQNGKPVDVWVYGLTKKEFEVKNHAVFGRSNGTGDHGADRGGNVDRGVGPIGQTEDEHQQLNEHADVQPGRTVAG